MSRVLEAVRERREVSLLRNSRAVTCEKAEGAGVRTVLVRNLSEVVFCIDDSEVMRGREGATGVKDTVEVVNSRKVTGNREMGALVADDGLRLGVVYCLSVEMCVEGDIKTVTALDSDWTEECVMESGRTEVVNPIGMLSELVTDASSIRTGVFT